MFGIGAWEAVVIFILALLLFGPKRLPELGRTIGRGMSEFRKASTDLQRTLNAELALSELPPPARPNRLDSLTAPRAAAPAAPQTPAASPEPAPAPEPAVPFEPVEPE